MKPSTNHLNRIDTLSSKYSFTYPHSHGLVPGLLLIVCSCLSHNARALDIELQYDAAGDGAIDPCSELVLEEEGGLRYYHACPLGVDRTTDLTKIFESAAASWEAIIEDDHEILIRYWWLDPAEGLPHAKIIEKDASAKPTEVEIAISADKGGPYFFDKSPGTDEEFLMQPRLYRTTHPEEKVEAFYGSVPEVFEVSFNGRKLVGGNDLLTIILHEMGHGLGVANTVSSKTGACTSQFENELISLNDVYYEPNPDWLNGNNIALKSYHEFKSEEQDFKYDCSHLAQGGIDACKLPQDMDKTVAKLFVDPDSMVGLTVGECASHQALLYPGQFPFSRMRPGATDIFAVADAAGWQDFNLPRKYSLGSGDWSAGNIWLGGREPGKNDDVYIVNQLPLFETTKIDVNAVSRSRNVYLSDKNELRVFNGDLNVFDTLTVAGPATETGPLRPELESDEPGGNPEEGIAETETRLQVDNGGVVKAANIVVESNARIEGSGQIVTYNLSNSGTIKASSGMLAISIPSIDPGTISTGPILLDLDGENEYELPIPKLLALEGDLLFDGTVEKNLRAAIQVGSNRSITFADGWSQGFTSDKNRRLILDGSTGEAVIHGPTTLNGWLDVIGSVRFSDSLSLGPGSITEIDIGGASPGSGHDQIKVDSKVTFNGNLQLFLTGGFLPSMGDSYVIVKYSDHTGEYQNIQTQSFGSNLGFRPEYDDLELRLVVGCDVTGANVIMGTSGHDQLIGTDGDDVIIGLEGNDNIFGLGGNDCIEAGPGIDNIQGGDGNDNIDAGEGYDNVIGGSGSDNCINSESEIACE